MLAWSTVQMISRVGPSLPVYTPPIHEREEQQIGHADAVSFEVADRNDIGIGQSALVLAKGVASTLLSSVVEAC